MENKLDLKTGYIEPVFDPEKDYVFGDAQAPLEVLQPDGQWTDLPEDEIQTKRIESSNCTGYGTLNAIEILLKKKQIPANYSDRGLGIFAGTHPPGNNPQIVAEALRKQGAFPETMLPFSDEIDSTDKYFSWYGGSETDCRKEAQNFLDTYEVKHDYVGIGSEISAASLKEALKHSPLGIAVFAWGEQDGKYVRLGGAADTHWTCLTGYVDNEYWKVYDSYPPYQKMLSWDFKFYTAKRYYIRPYTSEEKKKEIENLSLFAKILQTFYSILKQLVNPSDIFIQPDETMPPKIEPHVSKIKTWAEAIAQYENSDPKLNNPGAIRSKHGTFLQFATYAEGFAYLCDYLTRACTGKHLAYPKGGNTTLLEFQNIYSPTYDKNDPTKYATFIAGKVGCELSTQIKELL